MSEKIIVPITIPTTTDRYIEVTASIEPDGVVNMVIWNGSDPMEVDLTEEQAIGLSRAIMRVAAMMLKPVTQ